MQTRLLLTHEMPRAGMDILAARPDVALDILPNGTEAELAERISQADGLILLLERPGLNAETIARGKNLRIVCRCGAGYDHIDTGALAARHIPLVTTGDVNANAVAEHALYLLLAVAKKGPARDRAVRAGAWPRAFGATELRGKTCLVVGYGKIGQRIAQLAAAFGMDIRVSDPFAGGRIAADEYAPVDLDEGLAAADAVMLACALVPATHHLINPRTLAIMRSSAVVVNVARGGVVDDTALAVALAEGRIAGAGLDVLAQEPPAPDHPLFACETAVLTPHTASHVAEVYERMAASAAERALAGLDGRLDPAWVIGPRPAGT